MTETSAEHPNYTQCVDQVLEAERRRLGQDHFPRFGIALSGGGIRSASFALGVLQALVRRNILRDVDYLSTVSGGGYIGSSLVWWIKKHLPPLGPTTAEIGPKAGTISSNFPFGAHGSGTNNTLQNAILDYIRFHSSYLVPTRSLDLLSLFAVLIRNAFMSILIHLGVLVTLMFIVCSVLLVFSTLLGHITSSATESLDPIRTFIPSVSLNSFNTDHPVDYVLFTIFVSALSFSVLVFVVLSIAYSIGTLSYQLRQNRLKDRQSERKLGLKRYSARTTFQRIFGWNLKISLVLLLLASLPLTRTVENQFTLATGTATVALLCIFAPFSPDLFNARRLIDKMRRTFGAFLFLYLVAVIAYSITHQLLKTPFMIWESIGSLSVLGGGRFDGGSVPDADLMFWIYSGTIMVFLPILLGLGFFVNINYLGIHRLYRDRLMELFLPDSNSVLKKKWGLARNANATIIEEVCTKDDPRPYHLINANIVLVDSPTTKFRERGGDNFVISPLYCGSDATGWRRSDTYMKKSDPGLTLATAMAISGAAASPYAGAGGVGWTNNRAVSLVMSILNLRLGYWAPHPDPQNQWREIPNFIWPGIAFTFLGRWLHEKADVIDLTDGGHFENLGLYELIRRQLEIVVVCDGSADPDNEWGGLALAIERARVDFRATINFLDEDYGLDQMLPSRSGDGPLSPRFRLARRGFAVARIEYQSGKSGKLVYIRPTLVAGLSPEVVSYGLGHTLFPHERTSDQFFDERQFEAYRELGVHLGESAAPSIKEGNSNCGK